MIKKILFIFIVLTLWIPVADSAQFARPDSDVSIGAWTDDVGGTTDLWDTINESVASDADYIKILATDDTIEVGLTDLTDPVSSVDHVIRFRMWGTGAGQGEKITCELYDGATRIRIQSNNQSDGAWGDIVVNLSTGDADLIADYTDLRLRFTSVGNTGGSDELRISFAELEVPDAAAGGPTFTPTMAWWQN